MSVWEQVNGALSLICNCYKTGSWAHSEHPQTLQNKRGGGGPENEDTYQNGRKVCMVIPLASGQSGVPLGLSRGRWQKEQDLPACYLLMPECSEPRKNHLLICRIKWYIWCVCGCVVYICLHTPCSPYPISRYMDTGLSFGKVLLKSYPPGFDQTQASKISGACGWHLQEVFEIHPIKSWATGGFSNDQEGPVYWI